MERKGEWLLIKLPRRAAVDEASMEQHLIEEVGIPAPYLARLKKKGDILRTGDLLRLRFYSIAEAGFVSWWYPLEVLYEDDDCMVVHKPAGLSVHPAGPGEQRTLANAVASYYETTGQQVAVRHIHRLDQWTSGPVLYAKHAFAQYKLDADMREKAIERIYLAVVHGVPHQQRGTINAPIGKDRHVSGKRRVSPRGDEAITHYEVLARYAEDSASLLRLRLETGRTHQIRVHLSHIGHPIVGDTLYGSKDSTMTRQALHGERLRFHHPLSGSLIDVEDPMPEDIRQLILTLATK